ncbi:hypothetical protein R1sor_026257 [Riccia sorocarpa]|uniref:Esterase n=1 Tax=Riccia sorocarpa TaxID=122646 RepID=A0ABD3GGJ3_9MARC
MGKSLKSYLQFLLLLHILIQRWNPAFVCAQSGAFPAVVFIGASQSNVGVNNYFPSVARANFPPYGRDFVNGDQRGPTGRFSNGKILPDFICENFGLPFPLPYNSPDAKGEAVLQGINTASSASGWLETTDRIFGTIPGTEQVQWVRNWQRSLVDLVGASRASEIVRESPYIINLGDNDILQYFSTPPLQEKYTGEEYRKLMIDTAVSNIKDLYSGGARKFGVISAFAQGCLPVQLTLYQPTNRRQCVQKIQDFVQKYNAEYKAATQSLQSSLQGSTFYFADTFTITVDLYYNPKKYGLREETDIACCASGLFEYGPLCNSLSVGTCSNAATYFCFDAEHFTETSWRIIVNTFVEDLKKTLLA